MSNGSCHAGTARSTSCRHGPCLWHARAWPRGPSGRPESTACPACHERPESTRERPSVAWEVAAAPAATAARLRGDPCSAARSPWSWRGSASPRALELDSWRRSAREGDDDLTRKGEYGARAVARGEGKSGAADGEGKGRAALSGRVGVERS
jgi:hypothetical protein